jgi:hypothetical protein
MPLQIRCRAVEVVGRPGDGGKEAVITSSREHGRRRRPKGYADWRPHPKTRVLLDQVAEVLDEYDEHLPLSVRQIFYRLVGRFEYEKTERAYDRLAEALVRARRAELIAFDAIRDDGVVHIETRWFSSQRGFWDSVGLTAKRYRRDRQEGQRCRLELWSESAGMLPQLARVADAFSVPVYSSGGFSSLTAVRQIVERAIDRTHPTVLLHVGDHDPSGVSIFESIAEDVAAFVERDRIIANQRVTAQRVALTDEQVGELSLPMAPAKPGDSRSGSWSGETCQLEALAPDKLADIVRDAIIGWFDLGPLQNVIDSERLDRAELLRALPQGDAE